MGGKRWGKGAQTRVLDGSAPPYLVRLHDTLGPSKVAPADSKQLCGWEGAAVHPGSSPTAATIFRNTRNTSHEPGSAAVFYRP